mmetsp:Transcript_48413/g.144595  ORF Transcript_48413/g.144595 Transcript_48413/m.144595 type:complete len:165 (+) Transcript_48413:58-552(+)
MGNACSCDVQGECRSEALNQEVIPLGSCGTATSACGQAKRTPRSGHLSTLPVVTEELHEGLPHSEDEELSEAGLEEDPAGAEVIRGAHDAAPSQPCPATKTVPAAPGAKTAPQACCEDERPGLRPDMGPPSAPVLLGSGRTKPFVPPLKLPPPSGEEEIPSRSN